jgi:predicted permease
MPVYSIFTAVIFPIFFMIAMGFFIQKRFKFDITALTKMIFYALIPPLIFARIYQSALSLQEVGTVMLFTFGMIVIMGFISFPIAWIRGYGPAIRNVFALSVMFCNSGNYGLPVAELVFHQNPFGTSIQAAVLTMQNNTIFTLGSNAWPRRSSRSKWAMNPNSHRRRCFF